MNSQYKTETYFWKIGHFDFIVVDNFKAINLVKNWQCKNYEAIKTISSIGIWKLKNLKS
jgi:hypothetical protein